MNVETSPPSLSVADDFGLVQQFRRFVQWWINLDETPLPSSQPQAEREFEARSELPILTHYGNLMSEFAGGNLSEGLCDSLCFADEEGDETWLLEVYRVPTALRGELIPVLIHDHEVDAGTLVCLRTSSDDSRRLIGIREGELRGWTGTIGGLLVAHGLGCLASNRSKLHFSSVPPSCTPNLIFEFLYDQHPVQFHLDPRGALIRNIHYSGASQTDGVVRSARIRDEIGIDPRYFEWT
jgi:hypothetical protein